jgi:hypothetical protein
MTGKEDDFRQVRRIAKTDCYFVMHLCMSVHPLAPLPIDRFPLYLISESFSENLSRKFKF